VLAGRCNEVIIEALAASAGQLFRSPELSQSLPKVIELIGEAVGVDQCHLVEIEPCTRTGRDLTHHVWRAPGGEPPLEFIDAHRHSLSELGLESWTQALSSGQIVTGRTTDFEESVRRFLGLGGIKSVLAAPVFVEGKWWGYLAVYDCRTQREWTSIEIAALKTMAELIGAAVAHASYIKNIAQANRIIEKSPTVLYRLGPQEPFLLTYLSQNARRYGYDSNELLAKPNRWFELIESADLPSMIANLKLVAEGRSDTIRTEFRLKEPDGSVVWFDGEGYALRDEAGQLTGIEGILSDVTARKRSEAELSFSKLLLTTAIESSPDAILIVDGNDRIITFNRHFIDLWRIPSGLAHPDIDEPVLKFVTALVKNESEFLARVRYLYAHPEMRGYDELELKDGRVVERHSESLYNAERAYLGRVWFFRDITDRKRAAEKIAALARTDALTGLGNRAAFLDRLNLQLAQAKCSGKQFAVLYLDLDHFKDVNDTLGHSTGDALLRAVADRIRNCVRETDAVARFGGDEFAVLQDDMGGLAGAKRLASRIRNSLAAPYSIDGNQVHTTVSIGIVPYSMGIEGADSMLTKADLALYRAKEEGRNQFRFHIAELDQQVRERELISDDLHLAVEREELELFFQPQIALPSGRIVGLEALIRWKHPTRGLLLPSAFIPIAETTGNILRIGQWVIDQTCRQLRNWQDQQIAPTSVAVNLSAAQFKAAYGLDRFIGETLAKYHVAPGRLELELTESVFMETIQKHNEAFKKLRRLGVRLAVDDFGTGYSSLDCLRSSRVSRLKIDRRFVAGAIANPDDAKIVRATIALAHELGIEVVAEGVESAQQRQFLISAGCKVAQGYYLLQTLAGEPNQCAPAQDDSNICNLEI